MKGAVVLFFSLLFCLSGVYSQEEEKKGVVGVSFGTSVPLGSFSSSDINDGSSGYANPGFSGLLIANINIKEFWGFAGMFAYNRNKFDDKSYENNFQPLYDSSNLSFSSGSYELFSLLGGLFIALPQGTFDINLKGYIGTSVAILPGTNATRTLLYPGPSDPETVSARTIEHKANALTYGGGVNVIYYVNNKLSVFLDVNYLQAEPEFAAVEIKIYEDDDLTGFSLTDIKQKFQIVTLTLGVGYIF